MKAKNHQPISSEADAKEKLIVYVYEYLIHSGAKKAAQMFRDEVGYARNIETSNPEGPGFLVNWWCVFWDLYCAAPEKRNQIEPSSEARAFHEYSTGLRTVMSPSCNQTSPPQGSTFIGGPMMGGPRYGGPHSGPLRGGPMSVGPRMQTVGPPPQMGGPPPPHPPMMGAGSPRYATHPGHMTPGSSTSSGPMVPEPGPSPGVNRMTPNHSGSPHPQVVAPNGIAPMGGPPGGPHAGPPSVQPMPQGGPVPQMQQRVGPPQPWQNNFNVNSPADQQCYIPGPPVPSAQQSDFGPMIMNDGSGMMDVKAPTNNNGPPNQQQDEYVMPNAYGQGDQGEAGPEIMKLKESLENNTKEYSDGDQSGFNMDFQEPQTKW